MFHKVNVCISSNLLLLAGQLKVLMRVKAGPQTMRWPAPESDTLSLSVFSPRGPNLLLETLHWLNPRGRLSHTAISHDSNCPFSAESALSSRGELLKLTCFYKFVCCVAPPRAHRLCGLLSSPAGTAFPLTAGFFFSTWAAKLTMDQRTNNFSRFHGFCPHPRQADNSVLFSCEWVLFDKQSRLHGGF